MKNKSLRILALMFALVLVITACGGGNSDTSSNGDDTGDGDSEDGNLIGISILAADHGWLAALSYNAEEKIKETGINGKILTSSNINEQASNIDDLIGMNPSVIVLEPHTDEVKNAAQKIVDADIPLVLFDRIVDVDYTSYVTGNNPMVGTVVAEYLGEKLGNEGIIAVHNVRSADL